MLPPLSVISAMKPEVRDVAREWHVANRCLEAWLVDHDPCHALLFHQRADRRGFVGLGPFAMTQLDRQWKTRAAHSTNQVLQVGERRRIRSEAGWKLRQQGPELAGFG